MLLQTLVITEDREYFAQSMAQRQPQPLIELLTCPFLAFGTVEEICAQITRLREDFGITYVTVFDQSADDAATVLAALPTSSDGRRVTGTACRAVRGLIDSHRPQARPASACSR